MEAVGALVRDYVHARTEALAACLGQPEDARDVHRTRVSARRLRSVLGAYAAVIPDPGGLRHELRWLGSVAAGLRQLDVLAAAFDDDPELLEEIARQRAAELDPARSQLGSVRTSHVLTALEELVDEDGWSEQPAEPATRRVLSRETERVLARAEVAHLPGADRDARLHDVRKAAKRLRYSAELASPVLPAAAEVATRAERLQEVLGARNDRVAAQRWLADLAQRRPDLAQRAKLPPEDDLTSYGEALGALLR